MRTSAGAIVQDPVLPPPAEPLDARQPAAPVGSVVPIAPIARDEAVAPLTIACPAQVVTSVPFDCTLTIVRPGTLPAAGADLRVTVPPGLFHLANGAGARFDADSRQLVLPLGPVPRGSSRVSLSLMADDAGAGRTRTLSASMPVGQPAETAGTAGTAVVRAGAGEGANADSEAIEAVKPVEPVEAARPADAIEKPREPARFDASAAIIVAPGEPAVAGVFDSPRTPLTATLLVTAAIVAALWAVRARRRTRRLAAATGAAGSSHLSHASQLAPAAPGASHASGASIWSLSKETIGVSLIGATVSLLLLFVCMPACIETVRARTVFVATTCTILDRGSSGFAPEIAYIPMAIVRYEAAGRTRVASGFDVRGTMYGSNDPDASRLFTAGGRYPCWYDPAQPQRVILRQGPSAVAWFSLLPLGVLTLTLGVLLGVGRAGRD